MKITYRLATLAAAAVAVGGAGIGAAVAASGHSAQPHVSVRAEPTTPDTDAVQQGDQTTPDAATAASHAKATAGDGESSTENSESAPSDGPGGHADSGDVQYEFSGVQ